MKPNKSRQPMPTPRVVTIVIPAKDEETTIARTLHSLPLATLRAMGFDAEVVVLDGNSRDATAAIARRGGARVVADREPGKGAALRNARGLLKGEFVVMLDADATYPGDAIPRLVAPLARGEADAVMGRRRPQPGAMPRLNRVGNALLCWGASVLYWSDCSDVCTGLWAFRAEALRALPLRSRSFGLEAELYALASRLRLRIACVDVDYLPRAGQAKLHWARDGLRIARRLVRSRLARLDRAGAPAQEGSPAAEGVLAGEAMA